MPWVDIEDLVVRHPPKQREAREVLDNLARGAKARFYADENFPPKATAAFRAMGARVTTAQDVGLVGHSDEDHVSYAQRHSLVLATCDRDFLDERRHPLIHCPAIFVFNFASGSATEIRQTFRCLVSVLRMLQFFDKWWKIDAKRDSWIEYVRYADGSTSRHRCRLWRGKHQEWIED